jgi:hypothetical protein
LQSLASSAFKRIYVESRKPKHQHEVFGSLHSFLVLYVKRQGLLVAAAEDLFKRLQEESLQPGAGLDDALGNVSRLGQRIWSSDLKLRDVQPDFELEICSILNDTIRTDDMDLLEAAMPLIRAINSLCVFRGARPDNQLRFPQESKCFRGGGMPNIWLGFFQVDLKYRVPGFLATSFNRQVQELQQSTQMI